MTDYQILTIGLLLVIAVLVGLCAWGIWLHLWMHRINRPRYEDDYPVSKWRGE